jgi:putative alpha-1,2-mannosidase
MYRLETVTCFVKESLALPATFHTLLEAPSSPKSNTDNTKFVKIAIGTGRHGHTYPGATMPFGAVQLSPDTGIKDWDYCSGYHCDGRFPRVISMQSSELL